MMVPVCDDDAAKTRSHHNLRGYQLSNATPEAGGKEAGTDVKHVPNSKSSKLKARAGADSEL